ncbi:DUF7687 domain-containing protein [Priestia megaterium]|uniref:DUF7687 domain-containing protein n=1 Tax=Priestia megaterium TaxID=1404 RepID=UPI000F289BF1|nr:hypothetical protein [Priestia megaterium]RMA96907.1 hypothetical protein DEU44_0056 [Priestia megaterium]
MKPNRDFLHRTQQFWGYVRIISEKVGYSEGGLVKYITEESARTKLNSINITISDALLNDVVEYINYRARILNNEVRHELMNAEEAKSLFTQLYKIHQTENFTCKLPFNKQKEEKKDFAFYTGIINILTEQHLRIHSQKNGMIYGEDVTFDNDPSTLTYLKDEKNYIHGALSRRFDGAYPSTINPKAIWEIKEYYYTTSFGSRIADGVYETQLDGYEINELSHLVQGDIKHIYFIDAYDTWWLKGKSYLCRIIDMLHIGLVDEVIFGKEVINRWNKVLDELIANNINV